LIEQQGEEETGQRLQEGHILLVHHPIGCDGRLEHRRKVYRGGLSRGEALHRRIVQKAQLVGDAQHDTRPCLGLQFRQHPGTRRCLG